MVMGDYGQVRFFIDNNPCVIENSFYRYKGSQYNTSGLGGRLLHLTSAFLSLSFY